MEDGRISIDHQRCETSRWTAIRKIFKRKTFIVSFCLQINQNDQVDALQQGRKHGRWKCPFCTESFEVKSKLAIHLSVSHGAKEEFVCNQCNKTFSAKRTLKRHLDAHAGKMPHTCHICSKGFINPRDLDAHLNNHLGKKHYCPMCGKGFTHWNNRQQHIKKVHGMAHCD